MIVAPLLVVVIGSMVDRWSPVARRAAAGVAAIGVWMYAWLIGGVVAGTHTLIVDFDRTREPIGGLWRRLLPDGRADRAIDGVLFAVWVVLIAAVVVWIVVRGRRRSAAAAPLGMAA